MLGTNVFVKRRGKDEAEKPFWILLVGTRPASALYVQ